MFDRLNLVDFKYYIDISQLSYGIFISLLVLIICCDVYVLKHIRYKSRASVYLLSLILILFCTFSMGSDKLVYYEMFKNIVNIGYLWKFDEFKDAGWSLFQYIISLITSNGYLFFLIVSFFYVFFNLRFCLKQTSYPIYLFVAVISFMGFFSYGVNTIRAGFALSLILISLMYVFKSIFLFLFFSVIAISIHKSVIILVISILFASYYDNSKRYILFWIICLIISSLYADFIKVYFVNYFGDLDTRVSTYFVADNDIAYKTGFRWDFILYSLLPIVVGYYNIIRKNNVDKMYIILYNVYLLTNASWLLVIKIPYSDRFVYLSWFLYPYILLLPYLNDRPPQIKKAVAFIVILAAFSVYQLVK